MTDSIFKAPDVDPFVECPNCRQLLEYGAERCPRCREEIDADYALLSAVVVHRNTQAVSSANTIKTCEPAAVIIFFTSLLGYYFNHPAIFIVNLITPALALSGILVWFYRYGRFTIGDEDYLTARKGMWTSLKLWSALLFVQLMIILYMMMKTSAPVN